MDLSSSDLSTTAANQGVPVSVQPTSAFLLTGASGFLGSEIVFQAMSGRMPIHALGRSAPPRGPGVESFGANLVSDPLPQEAFAGCDQVLHVAGLAHQFGKKGDSRQPFIDVNVTAARRVAQAAADAGVRHFVLVSSVGVYGNGDGVRDESATCNPRSHYAISKLEGEEAVTEVCVQNNMQLTILRMATIYGEGDRGNTQRLIRGIDQGTLPFFGEGENRKSLIHVQDAAKACLKVVDAWRAGDRTTERRVFNIANQPASMLSIVQNIRASLGKSPRVRRISISTIRRPMTWFQPLPVIGKFAARVLNALKTWTRDDVYDGSAFKRTFGFQFDVSLPEGLSRQSQAYLLNQRNDHTGLFLKRAMDVIQAIGLLVLFSIPMLIVAILVKLTSKGPILYYSDRVGKNNKLFSMPKFRTMRIDTPQVATHLLTDANAWMTPIGPFLRKSSLDELPQLFSVLRGHMSFVGPRPALFNQDDLVSLRDQAGVSRLRPGITGWAQINGRDELAIPEKVVFDQQYLLKRGLLFDEYVTLATGAKVFRSEGVRAADEASGIADWLTLHLANDNDQLVATTPGLAFIVNEAVRTATASTSLPSIVTVRNLQAVAELVSSFNPITRIWIVEVDSDQMLRAFQKHTANPGSIKHVALNASLDLDLSADRRTVIESVRAAFANPIPKFGPPKPHSFGNSLNGTSV